MGAEHPSVLQSSRVSRVGESADATKDDKEVRNNRVSATDCAKGSGVTESPAATTREHMNDMRTSFAHYVCASEVGMEL